MEYSGCRLKQKQKTKSKKAKTQNKYKTCLHKKIVESVSATHRRKTGREESEKRGSKWVFWKSGANRHRWPVKNLPILAGLKISEIGMSIKKNIYIYIFLFVCFYIF